MSKGGCILQTQNLEALGSLTDQLPCPLLLSPPSCSQSHPTPLLPTHPSLHVSTFQDMKSLLPGSHKTGRIQRAHGLGANPDSLPCFEILTELIVTLNYLLIRKTKNFAVYRGWDCCKDKNKGLREITVVVFWFTKSCPALLTPWTTYQGPLRQ